MKGFLQGLILILITLVLTGVVIDQTHPITQQQLYVSFHLAGVLGIGMVMLYLFPRLPSPLLKIAFVIGALIAWRVSYFPLMVFSGHIASIGEWLLVRIPFAPVFIFPTFLVSLAAMNGLVTACVWTLLKYRDWKVYATIVPAGLFAAIISFNTLADLGQLLPDHPWTQARPVPPIHLPQANPYLPKITRPGYNWAQRAWLFAAGNTYALIPESPWARVVKGVLEDVTNKNPVATSATRVVDHYLAYLRAHRYIGCRQADLASLERCAAEKREIAQKTTPE